MVCKLSNEQLFDLVNHQINNYWPMGGKTNCFNWGSGARR